MRVLKTVFCILSCVCVAGSIIIGAIFGWIWFLAAFALAVVFGALMFLTKRISEPEPRTTDFMYSDEENAEIRREYNHDGSETSEPDKKKVRKDE